MTITMTIDKWELQKTTRQTQTEGAKNTRRRLKGEMNRNGALFSHNAEEISQVNQSPIGRLVHRIRERFYPRNLPSQANTAND